MNHHQLKKAGYRAQILGIHLDSTNWNNLLKKIQETIQAQKKLFIVTVNPEFLVYAHKHLWFKEILSQADITLPEGFGLILASKLLKTATLTRITGADLTRELLTLANQNHWSVWVVGNRRGELVESREQIERLKKLYPNVVFDNPSQEFKIVLACQGMGRQEKWISENINRINGSVFIGTGGSLDFLTGYTKRAPDWLRKMGLEWLWRGLCRPSHWLRIWKAVVVFGWLVMIDKLSRKV